MESNSYEFTAIRGIQSGTAYFVIMVPMKIVPRLFRFNDDEVPPTLRAQRILNRARVPAITRYITDNQGEYILSSLCASVDGEIEFEPAATEGAFRSLGKLHISMSATILINDGQHRRAAIEEAIKEKPALGEETISVVLFADRGLRRSQQMFADLNNHAVRPTRSIKLLYDHRDGLASLTREVVSAIPLFRDFTDLEKTSISNRSLKLFTLSTIHQSIEELLGKTKDEQYDKTDMDFAIRFWTSVIANMPDWQRVASRQVVASELRQDYIHAHGVAMQAIGVTGQQLVRTAPKNWESRLRGLKSIEWARSNRKLWDGRALVAGKINKSRNNVMLVSNVISKALNVPLTAQAEEIEALYAPTQKSTYRAVS